MNNKPWVVKYSASSDRHSLRAPNTRWFTANILEILKLKIIFHFVT